MRVRAPAARQSGRATETTGAVETAAESRRAAAHGPSCPPARPADPEEATPARRRPPRPPPVAPSTCARSSTQAPEPSPEQLPRPPALRSQRKRPRRPDTARRSRDAARRQPRRPLTARRPTRPPAARRPRSHGRRHQPPQAPWPAAAPTSAPDRSAGHSFRVIKLSGAGPHPRASGPRPQGGAGCPLVLLPAL